MTTEFLNNFSSCIKEQEAESRFLKYDDMVIDKPYHVRKIRMANTPFGERVRVYLKHGIYSLSGVLSQKMIHKYKRQQLGNQLLKGIKVNNLALVIKGRVGEGTHSRVNLIFEESNNDETVPDSDSSAQELDSDAEM